MSYDTRDYWVFGHGPTCGNLNNTTEHNVSETGYVSNLR
jgi:hypothetical protein